jgi:hypothetical protein
MSIFGFRNPLRVQPLCNTLSEKTKDLAPPTGSEPAEATAAPRDASDNTAEPDFGMDANAKLQWW